MTVYYAPVALIADEWQTNSRIHVDSRGIITAIDIAVQQQDGDKYLSGIVVPGLGNCHSHAFQRLFAGLTEQFTSVNDSFWSWRARMYQLLALLTPDDLGIVSRQLYIEMMKAGYTQVGEFHYLHNQVDGSAYNNPAEMSLALISAAKDVGIGLTLLPVLYQYSSFNQAPPEQAQQRFILSDDQFMCLFEVVQKHCADKRTQLGVAPHSLRAVDIRQFSQLHAALPEQVLTHIHIAEQLPEVTDCKAATGLRPVEYLYDNIAPDQNWSLIHSTHLTDDELALIKQSQAVIGLCPTTEANLGDGLCHIDIINSAAGIHWAIGSDSQISVDITEELRLLEYGQRLTSHRRAISGSDACPSTGKSLWLQALSGAARSIAASAGIKVGERADWLVLDNQHPSLVNLTENFIFDALIFSRRGNTMIKDVYIAGKKVISDGHHEREEVYQQAFSYLLKRLIA